MKNLLFFIALVFSSLQAGYHSQYQQDRLLNKHIFQNKKGGIFVEIGAFDGVKYSNTKFFEDELSWTGICVEPIPEHFRALEENRPNSICVNACIADEPGRALFQRIRCKTFYIEMLSGLVEKYESKHEARVNRDRKRYRGEVELFEVDCVRLDSVLDENDIFHIDYLSIDTEGGELDILKSIDFDRYYIVLVGVENNYNSLEFRKYMHSKGYTLIYDAHDEFYLKNSELGKKKYLRGNKFKNL